MSEVALEIKETVDFSHATPELFAALSVAQGKIENATKGSDNAHFKSKYADLAEVLNTARPVLSENGLGLIQGPGFDGKMVSVSTFLTHKGGGYISTKLSCVPAKTDAQGVGAATTYLRRYSAAAVCGIAQEDDDGNSSMHKKKPGIEYINDQQAEEIETLAESISFSVADIVTSFKVKTLTEIPAARFDSIIKRLKEKKAEIDNKGETK